MQHIYNYVTLKSYIFISIFSRLLDLLAGIHYSNRIMWQCCQWPSTHCTCWYDAENRSLCNNSTSCNLNTDIAFHFTKDFYNILMEKYFSIVLCWSVVILSARKNTSTKPSVMFSCEFMGWESIRDESYFTFTRIVRKKSTSYEISRYMLYHY